MISISYAGKSSPMRDRIVVTVLTVLAVTAAGCGTVMARTGPVSLAADAAATAATTSRVSMTVTTGAPGMWVTLTGTGAFDYAHARGWLRLGGPGFAVEERLIPPKLYVKLPGGPLGAHGKPWLAATMSGPGSGAAAPFLFAGPHAGPADLLTILSGAGSGMRKLGNATIKGVRVTHYRVTVDAAKAVSRARPAAQPRLRSLLSLVKAKSFPADVWVDSRGLVRRIRVRLDLAGGGKPAGAVTTETVTFSDFGVPVQVSAPPAADVASMPPVPGGGGSAGG